VLLPLYIFAHATAAAVERRAELEMLQLEMLLPKAMTQQLRSTRSKTTPVSGVHLSESLSTDTFSGHSRAALRGGMQNVGVKKDA
jgi:hypothetical protein